MASDAEAGRREAEQLRRLLAWLALTPSQRAERREQYRQWMKHRLSTTDTYQRG
jgi:hypothetical protein